MPDEPVADSKRFRMRLQKRLEEVVGDTDHISVGRYLEAELGINVRAFGGTRAYISWDQVSHWGLRDVPCSITLVGNLVAKTRPSAAKQFREQVVRIFSEESSAYRRDEDFGVHPAIDSAFQANLAEAIRGINQAAFVAARDFISRADQELMPGGDNREAVRAVFDETENVFKMMFGGAIALNKTTVHAHLRPYVETAYTDSTAKRSAVKSCDSLIDWADACHNYRHAAGELEPTSPPEDLAVALVGQGIAFVRWLIDPQRRP
jgi:hypothetical protein